MTFRKNSSPIKKYNPCRECLCMRCHPITCKYEKFYNAYPANAGCVHCMYIESDQPVVQCESFRIRRFTKSYKIKAKRKNPYEGIARLLVALHKEFKRL